MKGAMRFGVVFPQTEIGADPGAVRAYAVAAEDAGYQHLMAYDHVLGADPAVHTDWPAGRYSVADPFHEPFVLFGYLAAICSLELVTGVIILPQRQTVLVAKQAAEVDVLSGGRLRLGIGLGWNAIEYEALGQSFHDRGARVEEQAALLRRLWTEPSVTFEGQQHRVTGAGLAPLSVQRPIPLWFGANLREKALRRVGRFADGWIVNDPFGPELLRGLEIVRAAATAAGRDPASIGVEARLSVSEYDPDGIVAAVDRWREVGATHVSINTMRAGFSSVDEHIAALVRYAPALGL